MRRLNILITILLLSGQTVLSAQQPFQGIRWTDPIKAGAQVRGQGWSELDGTFVRLPDKAKQSVREPLWDLSRYSSGLSIAFFSNATDIVIRYSVSGRMEYFHIPDTGAFGVDMYTYGSDGQPVWCSPRVNPRFDGDQITYYYGQMTYEEGSTGREYQLLLPSFCTVESLEVGVNEGADLRFLPKQDIKPIVVYGTSIAQGACATRPGNIWPTIVGRTLATPVVNLGFSGNGKLEPEMFSLLSEVDASIYIIDCLPNMSKDDDIEGLLTSGVKALRKRRPTTPVLIIEHSGYCGDKASEQRTDYKALNAKQKEACNTLRLQGVKNIYYLTYEDIYPGMDGQVEGVHLNDLGMHRQAEAVVRKIRAIPAFGVKSPFPKGDRDSVPAEPQTGTSSLQDTLSLQEVVVVGYGGKTLRSRLTSSVSTVKNENLSEGAFVSAADALAGQVAGLVVAPSGNPATAPTVTLRGGTDWNGTGTPLYIIDGQLRDDLEGVNPDDIERIDVLKDASATAIYGARANNGVILVSTRTGKEGGRAEFGFKAKAGLSWSNDSYRMIGAEDYITYMRRGVAGYQDNLLTGANALGTGNSYGGNALWNIMAYDSSKSDLLSKGWKVMNDPLDSSKQIIYKETDIRAHDLRSPAVTQDYSAYASGGDSRGTYYLGLGFNDTQGLPVNEFNRRYSVQFNASRRLTESLESRTTFGYNRNNYQSASGYTSDYNYFSRVLATAPTARYEDEDGNALVGVSSGDGNQSAQAEKLHFDNQKDRFSLSEELSYRILPSLTLKGTASWLYVNTSESKFFQDYQTTTGVWNRTRQTSEYWQRDFSQTYNVTLDYEKTFADRHEVSAMMGGEYYDRGIKGFSASGSGASTDDFADLGYTSTAEGKRAIDSWHSTYRILSAFARVNYTLDGRYILSLVARQDGYSSLQNERWGFFPGVSAGWLFGQEEFVKEALPALSFGKLRVAWGQNGNATGIGAYDLQGAYSSVSYAGSTGYELTQIPNLGLRWERSSTFETGLDFSLFENRISAGLTFYNRVTSDKYASQTLPESVGYSSIKTNLGSLRNRGLEMELSAKIVRTSDFEWTLGANLTYNRNKVLTLPDNSLVRNRQSAVEVYTGNGNETEWVGGIQEGQEPGAIVGFGYKGVYRDASEIPAGLKVYNSFSGAWVTPQVGDAIWEDINGDNVIDMKDRKVLGYSTPHWTGGFNTRARWKGLSLYAAFDCALDYVQYDACLAMLVMSCNYNLGAPEFVYDTYSVDNTSATYPRYVYWDPGRQDNYFRVSDIFTRRADYLNLRVLTLSYTLPASWTSGWGCEDLTVGLTGENLFWLTATTTNVPQNRTEAAFNSSTAGGYAIPRTVLLNVSLKF